MIDTIRFLVFHISKGIGYTVYLPLARPHLQHASTADRCRYWQKIPDHSRDFCRPHLGAHGGRAPIGNLRRNEQIHVLTNFLVSEWKNPHRLKTYCLSRGHISFQFDGILIPGRGQVGHLYINGCDRLYFPYLPALLRASKCIHCFPIRLNSRTRSY